MIAVNCGIVSGSICFYEPTSLRRLYRIKAPGKLSKYINDSIRQIVYGKLPNGMDSLDAKAQTYHHGILQSMQLLAKKSVILCSVSGSNSINIMSIVTGELLVLLQGHSDIISCIYQYEIDGDPTLFTGSADGSVRVWSMTETLPSYLLSSGSFESSLNANNITSVTIGSLENKLSSTGTNSRRYVRTIFNSLCSVLGIYPKWRHAIIIGIYDGKEYSTKISNNLNACDVEVLFDDATVRLYSNKGVLRDPDEAFAYPEGPPRWSNPSAKIQIGADVVVYDIDPFQLTVLCARAMGISSKDDMSWNDVKAKLCALLVDNNSANGDILKAIDSFGKFVDSPSFSVEFLIDYIYKNQMTHTGLTKRFLRGTQASISAILFNSTSQLLVTIDERGFCCLWDPRAQRLSMSVDTNIFCGQFPYSLVGTQYLFHGFESAVVSDKNYTVLSTTVLRVPVVDNYRLPFCRESNNFGNALAIDLKFSALIEPKSGSTIKSPRPLHEFFYVLKDLSTINIETSCFLPSLVNLENPFQFLKIGILQNMTDISPSSIISRLQQVYDNRHSIVRIIYAVSSVQRTVDDLRMELDNYGVISRGHKQSPSEHVDFVVFERDDPEW